LGCGICCIATANKCEIIKKRGTMKFKQILIALILGIGLILSLGILGPISIVRAAGFTVDRIDDSNVDTCDEGTANDCSLRGAISAASASPGHDTITIDLAGTYVLTSGTSLLITSNLTITGTDVVTIDGNNTNRVFDISNTAAVTITNVIITNGSASTGAGIRNQGTLVLNDSTVTNNNTTNTGGSDDGGGIFNSGTLTVSGSTISNNSATDDGGGILNSGTATLNNTIVSENTTNAGGDDIGGGISNEAESADATLTLNNSRVLSNTVNGVGGGGIANSANSNQTATVVLSQTTVSGNIATHTTVASTNGFGGGIRNGFFSGAITATAIVTIENSTISNNQAINGGGVGSGTLGTDDPAKASVTINKSTINNNQANGSGSTVGNGGGIVNLKSTMSLINSTVSGNAANGSGGSNSGEGGGIANAGADSVAATLWLTNTTVASNTAAASGGGVDQLDLGSTQTANAKNSILAGNSASSGGPDCSGTLTSKDHNLIQDTSGCTVSGITANNITGQNPLLGLLQDNGGDTHTHALLSGSPAIDAADNTTCAASPVNGVDQRGEARDADCDIGAYEAGATASIYLPIVLKSSS